MKAGVDRFRPHCSFTGKNKSEFSGKKRLKKKTWKNFSTVFNNRKKGCLKGNPENIHTTSEVYFLILLMVHPMLLVFSMVIFLPLTNSSMAILRCFLLTDSGF